MTASLRSSFSARRTIACTQPSSSRATTASCGRSSARGSSFLDTYDVALLRQLFRGRVWNAVATLVVKEGVLWMPPGGEYAIGNDLFGEWTYEHRRSQRGQLRITRAGEPFSVLLFAHDDGSFRGWYVNLEQPQQRTPLGFDYEDDLLDVWVELGSDPQLLDEDELDEAVRLGFVSDSRAAEIRANAERVIAHPPWPTGWEDWQPEPGWQAPDLPPGWDLL